MEFPITKTTFAAVLGGLLAASLSACVGETPSFGGGGNEPDVDAGALDEHGVIKKDFDDNVKPLLTSFCGACHAEGTTVPFMGGTDMYTTVMEWPNLVSLKVPGASSLVAKGAHSGPAWQLEQKAVVQGWIQAESDFAPEEGDDLETIPFVPVAGENSIDLTAVGLAGATISFRMEPLSSGMYLSRMALNAGAEGVHIVHPTFVPWEGDTPAPDPVDRFSNVDIYAEANGSQSVGGGTLILVNTTPTAPISVRFELVEEANQGEVVLAGCADIPSFTANAQPLLSQNCVNCHGGGNGGATAATDMTQINDLSPAAQEAACGQILSRVNLLDSINSSVFVASEPGSNLGHPFKFNNNNANFTAFRDSLTIWIAAEQAAAQGNN